MEEKKVENKITLEMENKKFEKYGYGYKISPVEKLRNLIGVKFFMIISCLYSFNFGLKKFLKKL